MALPGSGESSIKAEALSSMWDMGNFFVMRRFLGLWADVLERAQWKVALQCLMQAVCRLLVGVNTLKASLSQETLVLLGSKEVSCPVA